MKLWLSAIFTILLWAALPGTTQTIWFDRTVTNIVNLRPEPILELRVYDFTPLIVFQGRIDTIAVTLTPMSAQNNQPKGDIKVITPTDAIASQFTPISLGNIIQFTPLTFTPLK